VDFGAGTTIDAALAVGSYNYSESTVWRNWTTIAGAEFTVGATGIPSIPVDFTPVLYSLYVNETGLPTGSTWYFNISGWTHVTTTLNATVVEIQNVSYT
jgi:hypothetical protein